ncbi:MAG: MBL fold metallo-hydrolase [Fervidobacterium sp.]
MFEIEKLTENVSVLLAPVNIGFIFDSLSSKVYIVDTGNSDDYPRKIMKKASELNVEIGGIINTHAHEDHIGGNNFLQKRTKCCIYTTRFEIFFIEEPMLMAMYLYGAIPFDELIKKLREPKGSHVTDIISPDNIGELEKTGLKNLKFIPLPGHSFDMVGITTEDGVFFIADSLVSRQVVDKYGVFFLTDVGKHLETLHGLKNWNFDDVSWIVPSHGKILRTSSKEDMKEFYDMITLNIQRIDEVCNVILQVCNQPATLEDLLRVVSSKYNSNMSQTQCLILLQTIKIYLNYLKARGMISFDFDGLHYTYIRK